MLKAFGFVGCVGDLSGLLKRERLARTGLPAVLLAGSGRTQTSPPVKWGNSTTSTGFSLWRSPAKSVELPIPQKHNRFCVW